MSIERSVRRAEQAKQLDRDTWADLDQVGFRFEVVGDGEAIAGPFYFGRAFDAPPIFSFSAVVKPGSAAAAPQITIGVSEWIIDEQDMYVGAYLWVVFENCFTPGPTNGVRHDDLENLLAAQGGGPEGDEIPYTSFSWFEHPLIRPEQEFSNLYWPSNYTWNNQYPGNFPVVSARQPGTLTGPYRWTQEWGGLENSYHDEPIQRWRISDTVSRTGSYSLFCDELVAPLPPGPVPLDTSGSALLVPHNILACDVYDLGYGLDYVWGWRCAPGTSVKISGWRRHNYSNGTLGTDQALQCSVAFYGEPDPEWDGFGHPGLISGNPGPTQYGNFKDWDLASEYSGANTWDYFEFSEEDPWSASLPGPVAPEGTKYVAISFAVTQFWLWRGNNSTPVPPFKTWLDDITIELRGPPVSDRAPEFDVFIKFQGRILKGYVAVHPLRSYEAPTKVVLS